MKHFFLLFSFVVFSSYSQCNKEAYVQFYSSTESGFSIKKKVSVTFGKGSEVSNYYNYIDYDLEALYCVITGFEEVYIVNLFTSYDNIYKTTCSSIGSIYSNGYIKGRDQHGRIWKVFKSIGSNYNNQDYSRPQRKYNPVKSSINIDAINSTLSSMQKKIDRNRAALHEKVDIINSRRDFLYYKIEKLNSPPSLTKMEITINNNIEKCVRNLDTGSNRITSATLSCLNRQLTNLDILESEINNYSDKQFVKDFRLIRTSKKDIDYCSIISVENKNGRTIIEFEYTSPYKGEGWINISPNTYLYDVFNKRKLSLLNVSQIEYSPKRKIVPYNEKVIFKLYFEQLPFNTERINVIECERDNCFNFYGVEIR